MMGMERWVLLSEVEDRMIREPDCQVRGMRGDAWLAVIGCGFYVRMFCFFSEENGH